jgi:hypothetical protein
LLNSTDVSKDLTAYTDNSNPKPEVAGSMLLRNICKYLPSTRHHIEEDNAMRIQNLVKFLYIQPI